VKRLILFAAAAAAALAGCGTGQFRVPDAGISTAQLESAMGQAADKRVHSDGETWYYYPRQPHGLAMFVARVDRDGKVIAVEQRLTDENVAKLEKGKTRPTMCATCSARRGRSGRSRACSATSGSTA